MNWYSGSIAEAVQQSKLRNAIFVVFVEGPNENSKRMADLIDTESIRQELESSKFLAIRIQSETESYTQFAQIYKLVPLPSVFFLGDNGVPLAIATEMCTTVDALQEVIRAVQQPAADQTVTPAAGPTAASNTSANDAASSSTAAVADIQPPATTSHASAAAQATSATPAAAAAAVEERLQYAKAVLEQKRKQHEAEQQRLEKERELERRRSGQDLRSFKERQTELELKQLKEERKRDQIAEQAQRKRILEQIAQDRAMSAARFANNAAAETGAAAAAVPAAPRVYTGNEARIQFRKPDGTVAAHDFLAADTFQTLRDYVAIELLAGCSNFTLASSFPRRLFGNEDVGCTLADLDLAPSAVILVQSSEKSLQAGNSGSAAGQGAGASSAVRGAAAAVGRLNVFGLAQTTFWTLMMPVLALINYVRSLLGGRGADAGAQKRANEERVSDNDAAKRRNLQFGQSNPQPSTSTAAGGTPPTAYKRTGGGGSGTSNIHRLRETQDSDDDTNTWNGNSTQQQ